MLLSPCWASVAPSASGSAWVTSSLAHLRCVGTNDDLKTAVRSEGGVRDVIERHCDRSGKDVGFEGVDESTRNVARRRQILPKYAVSC